LRFAGKDAANAMCLEFGIRSRLHRIKCEHPDLTDPGMSAREYTGPRL
jgi:hypothetical protein